MRNKLTITLAALLLSSAPVFAEETPVPAPENIEVASLQDPAEADPLNGVNQPVFNFNVGFDRHVAQPVASAYHELPEPVREGAHNFLSNLGEPLNVVHGVLQLNPKIAFTSFWRFVSNSTVGFGGLRDFAGEQGLSKMDQNLGKTLGRWGVDAGPYVVLPLLGPSSVRDTAGRVGDFVMNPVGHYAPYPQNAEVAANGVESRDAHDATVDHFYYQSVDPYSATRSAYRQHEEYEVKKAE